MQINSWHLFIARLSLDCISTYFMFLKIPRYFTTAQRINAITLMRLYIGILGFFV